MELLYYLFRRGEAVYDDCWSYCRNWNGMSMEHGLILSNQRTSSIAGVYVVI